MKDFEYKVGDYVYCYNDNIFRDDICIHKKGNLYKIKEISTIFFTVILLSCEFENMFLGSYWMPLHPFDSSINLYKDFDKSFYDHFLSKQQYRKIKLEKFKLEKLYDRI